MRYKVKPDGTRFSVVDTEFNDTLICHTGSQESAQKMADDYNSKHSNAPRPTSFINLAERRRAELLAGEVSVEKEMSQHDWLMMQRVSRESQRFEA